MLLYAIYRVKVPPSSTAKCGLWPRACVRDWILESRAYYEEFAAKEKTETEPSPLHAVQKRPAQGQGEDGAALPGDDPGEERTITILRRGKHYALLYISFLRSYLEVPLSISRSRMIAWH